MRGFKVETYKLHEIRKTGGRRRGSWFQQSLVNAHNPSVKAGWVGRGGRSPPTIANIAARGGLLLNGTAPVTTFVRVNNNKPDVDPEQGIHNGPRS